VRIPRARHQQEIVFAQLMTAVFVGAEYAASTGDQREHDTVGLGEPNDPISCGIELLPQ
jgi:hypothetical protein